MFSQATQNDAVFTLLLLLTKTKTSDILTCQRKTTCGINNMNGVCIPFRWASSRLWCCAELAGLLNGMEPLLIVLFTPVCCCLLCKGSVTPCWYFLPPPLSSVCQLARCGWTPTLCLTPVCRSLVTKTAAPALTEDRRWVSVVYHTVNTWTGDCCGAPKRTKL